MSVGRHEQVDSPSPDDEGSHRHPPRPDLDDTLTYHRAMEMALRELLIEKGVFTADEIRRQVEDMDNRTPAQGARVVAKAWVDPS
jgi:nitrile hydratase